MICDAKFAMICDAEFVMFFDAEFVMLCNAKFVMFCDVGFGSLRVDTIVVISSTSFAQCRWRLAFEI